MIRVAVFLVAFLACSVQAQDLATSFESTEIVPGITMVTGLGGFGGGNMAILAGEEYVAMIDDSMTPLAPILLEHVADTAGRPVNFMINTHVHGDHVGGNAQFAEDGTIIFAHDNIRKRLIADSSEAGGDGGLPVVTFAEGLTFHLNGLEARVVHVPAAHTDGDAIIHFPDANVIHAGDTLFNGLFPFIDLESGGTINGFMAAQQKLWSLADEETKIIPGHGELASKADLRANIEMLEDSRALVQEMIDAGKSEDEILAANPLARYHDDYNWSFITTERMTRTLYYGLTQ